MPTATLPTKPSRKGRNRLAPAMRKRIERLIAAHPDWSTHAIATKVGTSWNTIANMRPKKATSPAAGLPFCPQCGTRQASSWRFCGQCGAKRGAK